MYIYKSKDILTKFQTKLFVRLIVIRLGMAGYVTIKLR